MSAKNREHVTAATVLTAVMLLATSAAVAQTASSLTQKSADAAELVAIAQQDGHVRVIVQFESPVSSAEIRPDKASLAIVRAQVAARRDAIIETHFGSAQNPRPGGGFDRGLTRFDITPGFAVNVNQSELGALAADPRVRSIHYDRPMPPTLIQSVPLIGMNVANGLGATGGGQAIAVLDTGVQANHEFLNGGVVAEACFSNSGGAVSRQSLCPNNTDTQIGPGAANPETPACIDELPARRNICTHGTHVAGIAAGLNTSQTAGEPPNGVARLGFIWAIQVFTRFNRDSDCPPPGPPAPCVRSFPSDQIRALDHVFARACTHKSAFVSAAKSMSASLGKRPKCCVATKSASSRSPLQRDKWSNNRCCFPIGLCTYNAAH